MQIAGVALNGIARPGDTEESLREMETIDNLEYHRIFGLLANVNRPLDLFARYNVDKIFELRILSVDSGHRGKGLAKQLFARSETLARERGFKVSEGAAFERIFRPVLSGRIGNGRGQRENGAVKRIFRF